MNIVAIFDKLLVKSSISKKINQVFCQKKSAKHTTNHNFGVKKFFMKIITIVFLLGDAKMQKFYFEEPSNDLKENFFDVDENFLFEVSVASSFVKTQKQQNQTGREIGNYIIINSPNFLYGEKAVLDYTQKIFFRFFKKFVRKKYKRVLIAGIGNEFVEADCFGPLCVNKLHLKKDLYAIKPNVFENTNILSFDVVDGICKVVKPDLVILIDSLGTRNIKRLTCSFQLTDTGLLPGGALGNANKTINKKNLGVDCLIVGVPSMIFAGGLDSSLENRYKNIILAPKDVRITLDSCADIVCNAISKFL